MADATCADCRFAGHGANGSALWTTCRRRAPVAAATESDDGSTANQVYARWPVTSIYEWCGEHEPKPQSQPEIA